jgi:hypothetical protein
MATSKSHYRGVAAKVGDVEQGRHVHLFEALNGLLFGKHR